MQRDMFKEQQVLVVAANTSFYMKPSGNWEVIRNIICIAVTYTMYVHTYIGMSLFLNYYVPTSKERNDYRII